MDLQERTESIEIRYQCKCSRLKAIRTICRRIIVRGRDLWMLDVGCGDGFINRDLAKDRTVGFITGVDIGLSEYPPGLTGWALCRKHR